MIRKYILLKQLRKNCWRSSEEIKQMQAKKLKSIIKHCYKNVPYYHSLFRQKGFYPDDFLSQKDLVKMPVLTKLHLQSNPDDFLARGSKVKIVSKTSGTTGVPLAICLDSYAADYKDALRYRALFENGFKLTDKMVEIVDTRHFHKTPFIFRVFGMLKKYHLSIRDDNRKNLEFIKNKKPDVIYSYPSVLRLMAKDLKQNTPLPYQPKIIFTSAETMTEPTKKLISDAFSCPVIDLYGATEFGRLAWECEKQEGYHMDIDSSVIELSQGNNGEGEIIVTGLYNYAMPLLRYRIGDYGEGKNEKCSCGRSFPLLRRIEGRQDDFILLKSGRIISPRRVNVLEFIDGINEYTTIQTKEDSFVVKIVPSQGFSQNTVDQIKKEIIRGCGEDVNVDVQVVDKIERRGKIRTVMSQVRKQDASKKTLAA
ncbi:MAG: AMP-binding protein [Candidatus Woesearchaeota archaeon]